MNKSIFAAANSVAVHFTQKEKALIPVTDTPLFDIVNQCRLTGANNADIYTVLSGNTTDGNPISTTQAADAVIHELDGFEEEYISARKDVSKQYAKMISDAVAQHMSFARNTVNTVIITAIENFNKIYTSIPNVSDEFKIIKLYLPEVLKNPEFSDEITIYKNKSYDKMQLASTYFSMNIEYTKEQLIDFLVKAHPAFASDITVWLNRINSLELFNFVFNNQNQTTSTFPTRDIYLMDYLVCSALRDNPPQSVKMPLQSWRNQMDNHIFNRGALLNDSIVLHNNQVERGYMIDSIIGKNITVNAVVYDSYITNGGSDELILANSLSKTSSVYVTDMISKTEPLMKLWDSYCLQQLQRRSVNQLFIARQAALDSIKAIVNTDYDKLIGWKFGPDHVKTPNSDYVFNKLKEFEYECAGFSQKDTSNVAGWFIDKVCKVFYPETAAGFILSSINIAHAQNDKLTPDQAAAIAKIEYVCKYIADQVLVK